jgi:hypothetical protein
MSLKVPPIDDVIQSMNRPMASGAMHLQSHNIPMDQYPSSQLDPGIQPNYAYEDTTLLESGPTSGGRQRYIEQQDDDDSVIEMAANSAKHTHLEETYNAIQIPIIIGVLFFLFQLPIVKTLQINYIPFAFAGDGNWNTTGILINSLLFSIVFFILQKFLAV